ncbi:hypothetical protein ASF08_22015 [Methylobacterium sp. Leaf85]|nr:hypothetical protein ASF08_22015 [Methylobacterium sp. Leaf85]
MSLGRAIPDADRAGPAGDSASAPGSARATRARMGSRAVAWPLPARCDAAPATAMSRASGSAAWPGMDASVAGSLMERPPPDETASSGKAGSVRAPRTAPNRSGAPSFISAESALERSPSNSA